jgi:SulP family sulfate permease
LNLIGRFKASGIELVFSGLKKQVADVMQRTGLIAVIGSENIFPTDKEALAALLQDRMAQPSPETLILRHAA